MIGLHRITRYEQLMFLCDFALVLQLPDHVAVESKAATEALRRCAGIGNWRTCLSPTKILDWKTSAYAFKFDAYYRSLQWRFYLDMTGRDHFRYIGLQIRNPIERHSRRASPDRHRRVGLLRLCRHD